MFNHLVLSVDVYGVISLASKSSCRIFVDFDVNKTSVQNTIYLLEDSGNVVAAYNGSSETLTNFDEAYACAFVSLNVYYVTAITDNHLLYHGQN